MPHIEEHWLEQYVTSCKSKRVAIDVGANRGEWTSFLAMHFDHVAALEPDPRASAEIPQLPNVSLIEAAVGASTARIATLHLRESPDQNSLLEQHPIGAGGGAPAPAVDTRDVKLVTLDSRFPHGADLVKIDVEGTEVDVLRGCTTRSSWERTRFIVECHDTYPAVEAELVRLGKTVTLIPHPYHAHPGHCWAIGE